MSDNEPQRNTQLVGVRVASPQPTGLRAPRHHTLCSAKITRKRVSVMDMKEKGLFVFKGYLKQLAVNRTDF